MKQRHQFLSPGRGGRQNQLHKKFLSTWLLHAPQVQPSGAGTGVKGGGNQIFLQNPVHFPGIFRGEVHPDSPQAQLGKIVLPVQPVELLAVEKDAAAGVGFLHNGEIRTGFVGKLYGHAALAAAFTGFVLN